jgi:formamidopyrimidine-DNA glycosylase
MAGVAGLHLPTMRAMPELPEVEITARLLDRALAGAQIESTLAPGINALKTFDPPLSSLEGLEVTGVGRRGKQFVVKVDGSTDPLVLLIHLMSAGRLQLYDKRAGPRDRTSRLLVRFDGGRELRLREFGSKQAAWVKLLPAAELDEDPAVATLGPEAWPDPPDLGDVLDAARPLHALLRDQRTIAGIGRSWVDEILWEAKLSPYKRGADLEDAELAELRESIVMTLGRAITHYEEVVELPIPDKLPMPLRVHRHEGEPCPRCGTTLEAVHFESYVIAYCPVCQTEGRTLKDRRLSKLLK